MGWILAGVVVAVVLMMLGPFGWAAGAGLVLGTLWYIASILERIAVGQKVMVSAATPPGPDPEEIQRRRDRAKIARLGRYRLKRRPKEDRGERI